MAASHSNSALAPVPAEWAAPQAGIARMLLPNLAAMIAAATLIYCLFVFGGGERLFRDSDSGWHIRNGEWILDHRALPRSDPYSFSKAGAPWVAWEWGSDALMAGAYRADGLRGVGVLFALAIALCSWMWCRLSFDAGGDFFLTALFAAPMITTMSLHWLARPHVLSWVFALGAVWWAERVTGRGGWKQLAVIAAVAALWANLHASFFLAPAIGAIYAAAHFLRPLLWTLDAAAERAKARWFAYAALAGLAGSLLNPYGWRLHAHVLSYLWNDELTSRIAEFQSFNFHEKDAIQVALAMGLAAIGGMIALRQGKLAQFLLAAVLVWGALRSARVIPLVALLLLPLANAAFTEAIGGARDLRVALQRRLNAVLAYSRGLRRIDRTLSGAVFTGAVVLLSMLALRSPALAAGIGFAADRFPVAAAAAIEKLPAEARILAPDNFGGYLIYRFHGERKVFFDGRSDFYGVAFMKQYLVLIRAQPGWQELVHSFGFTHALLPGDSALRAALEQAGWRVLYGDGAATLLEAPQ